VCEPGQELGGACANLRDATRFRRLNEYHEPNCFTAIVPSSRRRMATECPIAPPETMMDLVRNLMQPMLNGVNRTLHAVRNTFFLGRQANRSPQGCVQELSEQCNIGKCRNRYS
jgi:hypothetical protein